MNPLRRNLGFEYLMMKLRTYVEIGHFQSEIKTIQVVRRSSRVRIAFRAATKSGSRRGENGGA